MTFNEQSNINNQTFFVSVGERGNGIASELITILYKNSLYSHLIKNFFMIFLNSEEKANLNSDVDNIISEDQIVIENLEGFNVWITDFDHVQLTILNPIELFLHNNLKGDFKADINLFIISSLYSSISQSILEFINGKISKIYKNSNIFGITLFPTSISNTGPIELYSCILGFKNFKFYISNLLIDYFITGKYFNNLGMENQKFSDIDFIVAKLLNDLINSHQKLSDIFSSVPIYKKLNLFYFVVSQPNISKKVFLPRRGDLYKNWFQSLHSLLFDDFIPTKGNEKNIILQQQNTKDFAVSRNMFVIGGSHDFSYLHNIVKIFSNELMKKAYFDVPAMQLGFIGQDNKEKKAEILMLENSTIILNKLNQILTLYKKNIAKKAYLHLFQNSHANIEQELESCSKELELIIEGYNELFL